MRTRLETSPLYKTGSRVAMAMVLMAGCADVGSLDALKAQRLTSADGAVGADVVNRADAADGALPPTDVMTVSDVIDASMPIDMQMVGDNGMTNDNGMVVDSGVDSGNMMGTDVVDVGMTDRGGDTGTDSVVIITDAGVDTGSDSGMTRPDTGVDSGMTTPDGGMGCTLTSLSINQGRPVNLNGSLSSVPVRVGLSGTGCDVFNGLSLPLQIATLDATGTDAGVQTLIEDNSQVLAMGSVLPTTTSVNAQLNLARFSNLDGKVVRVNVVRGGVTVVSGMTSVYTFAPSVNFRSVYSIPAVGFTNMDVTSNLPSSVSLDCSVRYLTNSGTPWFMQGSETSCSTYLAPCDSFSSNSNTYNQVCGVAMNSSLTTARYSCLMDVYSMRVAGGDSRISFRIPTGNPEVRPSAGMSGRVRIDCVDPRSGNVLNRSTTISS